MAHIQAYCQHLQYVWRDHINNQDVHGSLPQIVTILKRSRLRLASHVIRHDEVCKQSITLEAPGPWEKSRPTTTLREIIQKDTVLSAAYLLNITTHRDRWKEHIMLITFSA